MLMDTLKLEQLKRHYKNEMDAIKHAIINELNRDYNVQFNDNGTRRFLYINKISKADDYYRVEVTYIDYFITGPIRDMGIYYIHEEVL